MNGEGNGLSLPIGWLLCCGMQYEDPDEQAQYDLGRLLRLPEGVIFTTEDKRVIQEILDRCSKMSTPDTELLLQVKRHLRLPEGVSV